MEKKLTLAPQQTSELRLLWLGCTVGREPLSEFVLLKCSQIPSRMPTSEATELFSHKTSPNLVEQLGCWHSSWVCAHSYRRAVFRDREGFRLHIEDPVTLVLVLLEF